MTDVNINVHQITRVEGHGNIILNAREGKIEELRWEVTESPRFFEAILRGRYYEDIAHIASRICGICSIAHTIASIQATEAAFGIETSEQTWLLRKLLFDAELIESHVLHTHFLAAPDYLGAGSVFSLINTHKDVVLRALKLKRLAYDLGDALAGRKTHPISCVVGGFAKLPQMEDLKALKVRLQDALTEFDATADLFKTIKLPDFVRETEYIALTDPEGYAFIKGQIGSTDTGITPISDYLSVAKEFCVPHSTAKYTRNNRDSYMVGALSRFNLNHHQLMPYAKKTARKLNLEAPNYNPFAITIAQLVEAVHATEEAISLIDRIISFGLEEQPIAFKVRAGQGVGAVEAPRGLLIHDYTYDRNGTLTNANCIIPTNQNHNNIQKDMEALVPSILEQPEDKIRLTLEMLVRAYDPCISCSTHLLQVKFK